MSIYDTAEIHLNPREAVSFSPIAAEQAGREAYGHPRALRADASGELRADTFTLSDRGRAVAELEQPGAVQNEDVDVEQRNTGHDSPDESEQQAQPERSNNPRGTATVAALSTEDQQMISELRRTDQKVRAHEQAHAAAGGTNVRYEYETGPDGRSYAVSGTTDIAVRVLASDANGKLAQARKLRAAAMAPADPSAQDLAVTARAVHLETEARAEKAEAALKDFFQNG